MGNLFPGMNETAKIKYSHNKSLFYICVLLQSIFSSKGEVVCSISEII